MKCAANGSFLKAAPAHLKACAPEPAQVSCRPLRPQASKPRLNVLNSLTSSLLAGRADSPEGSDGFSRRRSQRYTSQQTLCSHRCRLIYRRAHVTEAPAAVPEALDSLDIDDEDQHGFMPEEVSYACAFMDMNKVLGGKLGEDTSEGEAVAEARSLQQDLCEVIAVGAQWGVPASSLLINIEEWAVLLASMDDRPQKLYRITEADLQEVAGSFRGFEDSAIDIGTQMWVLTPTCISCMISFVHSI